MNKPVAGKSGKPKLQLKGRIFMQNVTETISLRKPGKMHLAHDWLSESLNMRLQDHSPAKYFGKATPELRTSL